MSWQDDRKAAYAKKLRDPRWQKKRLEILSRDEWACQSCFDTEATLNVHHRYYDSEKDPWDYPDEALVTLCEGCHEVEGPEMRRVIQLVSRELSIKFLAGDVLSIAEGIYLMRLQHVPGVVASAIGWAMANDDMQREIIDRYFSAIRERRGGHPHPESPEAKLLKSVEAVP